MPMAVEDNVTVGFGSSYLQDPSETNPTPHVPSPDDLAWADSCLVKDSEILDSSWDSLKDALLNIVNSEPTSQDFSATENGDGSTEETHPKPPGLKAALDEIISSDEEIGQKSGLEELFSNGEQPSTKTYLASPFRPNYSEDQRVNVEDDDSGLDFDSPVATDASSDDIFKVWDLETPTDDEEDELIKQLNKALAGSGPATISSAPAPNLGSLDDLVDAISDLSLGKNSA